jgi:hypothetical protein
MFTAYNRPHYLRETLESWSRVRGIENTFFEFHVEPGCAEIVAVINESAISAPVVIHINDEHLGPQANPFHAIHAGFSRFSQPSPNNFVILAEDDFIVSDDIIEYLSWARDKFAADERVIAVSSTQFEEQPGGLSQVMLIPSWTGWVWGTWRDRWENLIAPNWTFNHEYGGWDWKMVRYWCGERGYLTAVPALSRSQHIGKLGGSYTTPETFSAHVSRCFVPGILPQVYQWDSEAELVPVSYHHTGT